jgi:hypothetical protein
VNQSWTPEVVNHYNHIAVDHLDCQKCQNSTVGQTIFVLDGQMGMWYGLLILGTREI